VGVLLSAALPASLAKADITLTSQDSNNANLICMGIHTKPQQEVKSEGGTLAMTWEDCSDSSYHGKVTAFDTSSITLGQDTTVTGSGSVDEAVTGGNYALALNAGIIKKTFNGDICTAQTFDLPLGSGKLTWKGLNCPLAAGPQDVAVGVLLSAALPASLAKADITLTSQDSNNANLICMGIHTKPEQAVVVV